MPSGMETRPGRVQYTVRTVTAAEANSVDLGRFVLCLAGAQKRKNREGCRTLPLSRGAAGGSSRAASSLSGEGERLEAVHAPSSVHDPADPAYIVSFPLRRIRHGTRNARRNRVKSRARKDSPPGVSPSVHHFAVHDELSDEHLVYIARCGLILQR